jgi:hypothetical protein
MAGHLFILSQGDLLGKETSQTYMELQRYVPPSTSKWLEEYISILTVALKEPRMVPFLRTLLPEPGTKHSWTSSLISAFEEP